MILGESKCFSVLQNLCCNFCYTADSVGCLLMGEVATCDGYRVDTSASMVDWNVGSVKPTSTLQQVWVYKLDLCCTVCVHVSRQYYYGLEFLEGLQGPEELDVGKWEVRNGLSLNSVTSSLHPHV